MLDDVLVIHLISLTLTAVLLFAGGAAGGLARWGLTRTLPPRVGTWASNMVGAAVAGFVVAAPVTWQFALGLGFAGAVSTWSTLAKELGELIKQRNWGDVARYALGTAVLCLVAAAFGLRWGARGF